MENEIEMVDIEGEFLTLRDEVLKGGVSARSNGCRILPLNDPARIHKVEQSEGERSRYSISPDMRGAERL